MGWGVVVWWSVVWWGMVGCGLVWCVVVSGGLVWLGCVVLLSRCCKRAEQPLEPEEGEEKDTGIP